MKYRAMNKIEVIVYEELKGKNAGSDTIKMLVRVAIKASGIEFTEEEINGIMTELLYSLPFNPLEEVF